MPGLSRGIQKLKRTALTIVTLLALSSAACTSQEENAPPEERRGLIEITKDAVATLELKPISSYNIDSARDLIIQYFGPANQAGISPERTLSAEEIEAIIGPEFDALNERDTELFAVGLAGGLRSEQTYLLDDMIKDPEAVALMSCIYRNCTTTYDDARAKCDSDLELEKDVQDLMSEMFEIDKFGSFSDRTLDRTAEVYCAEQRKVVASITDAQYRYQLDSAVLNFGNDLTRDCKDFPSNQGNTPSGE